MIAAGLHRSRGQKEAHVKGWLVSILLHSTVALVALLLVKQTHFKPQDESFKWNVTMVSPVQPIRPAVSVPNEALAASAPSATSVPSPKMYQIAPVQNIPSPQLLVQKPTPSNPEQDVTSVMAEPPAPAPLQPTEPIDQGSAPPMAVKAPSIDKLADTPTAVSGESGSHSTPPSTPPVALEETEYSDQATATQMARISPILPSTPAKRDYGWLSETILRRVEEMKRYPASARVDRAEGKVIVKAVINEDGSVGEVEVFRSSGHLSLDKAAVETLRLAAPFHLPHPLDKSGMTIKIPMSYRLDR